MVTLRSAIWPSCSTIAACWSAILFSFLFQPRLLVGDLFFLLFELSFELQQFVFGLLTLTVVGGIRLITEPDADAEPADDHRAISVRRTLLTVFTFSIIAAIEPFQGKSKTRKR